MEGSVSVLVEQTTVLYRMEKELNERN